MPGYPSPMSRCRCGSGRTYKRFSTETRFLGLSVIHATEAGDEGEVRFVATLEREGRDVSFGETSRFRRVAGRWLYLSGAPT